MASLSREEGDLQRYTRLLELPSAVVRFPGLVISYWLLDELLIIHFSYLSVTSVDVRHTRWFVSICGDPVNASFEYLNRFLEVSFNYTPLNTIELGV